MIRIDASKVIREVLGALPAKRDLNQVTRHIGEAMRAEWIRLAGQEVKSTSRDYIQGIGTPELTRQGRSVAVSLEGALPNMIEHGWPGGDLRHTLAVSTAKRAKKSKKGHYYNVVPFRHGTPGTGGRNVGAAMAASVYRVAKTLQPRERIEHSKMVTPVVRALIEKKISAWHASGQYEGMQKKGGGYFTFRVISQAQPRGWIHPGIRARRLAGKVQEFITKVIPTLVHDLKGTK